MGIELGPSRSPLIRHAPHATFSRKREKDAPRGRVDVTVIPQYWQRNANDQRDRAIAAPEDDFGGLLSCTGKPPGALLDRAPARTSKGRTTDMPQLDFDEIDVLPPVEMSEEDEDEEEDDEDDLDDDDLDDVDFGDDDDLDDLDDDDDEFEDDDDDLDEDEDEEEEDEP